MELVFFLSLLTLLGLMKISNTELKADNKIFKNELERNAKDYKVAIDEYTENIKHRDVIYKTKTEKIYIWEDKNASCENVINRFDNYTF